MPSSPAPRPLLLLPACLLLQFIGNMHGDEDGNRESLLRLLTELCAEQESQEPRIVELLRTTVLHILPVMNPDGALGAAKPQRANARGIDLNRDFITPEVPFTDSSILQGRSSRALQPETAAVMAWIRAHPPSVSANFHGGALVANYPLDTCSSVSLTRNCPTSQEPLPLFLAQVYAQNHPQVRRWWGVRQPGWYWPNTAAAVQMGRRC